MVKAEALINLSVAFEAGVQIDVALEDELFLGENITIRFQFNVHILIQSTKPNPPYSCQVTDPDAFPVPTLSLLLCDSGTCVVILEEEQAHSLSVDIALQRENNGASYLCRSEQTLQLGNETM